MFRISFDTGGGWVVFTPYNNNLVWSNENDINPAITRIRLTGDITFFGSEYTTIKNFKDAGNNYIPILVEQEDSGWNDIFEGNADLLMPWDENRTLITLNKFNNGDDKYDNLISNYTTRYGLKTFSLTGYVINTPSVTSMTIDAVKVAGTGLTPAQYIAAYDINGNGGYVPGFTDPRWVYFLFRSTNGDGSHNFETMSFDYATNIAGGYTYINLIQNNSMNAYWVKLPPGIGSTETISTPIVYTFNRFPDVMGALLVIAVSTLTFTEATALTYAGLFDGPSQYAWFDYTLYQIGEAAEIAQEGFKDSEISLKDCFDIMEAFGLYWYLDGSALKFKHQSELSTSGTLDLSTETVDLQRLNYIEADEIPDIETWKTLDSKGVAFDTGASDIWGEMQIYYRSANSVLSNARKLVHEINLSTNVVALMAGLAETGKNNLALIETEDNTTVPRVVYTPVLSTNYNSRLNAYGFFNNQVKWRYGTSANLATRLKFGLIALVEFETRPLLKIPITNYYTGLLTSYDMDKAITVSAGTGKTKTIKQRLNTDFAELEIEL